MNQQPKVLLVTKNDKLGKTVEEVFNGMVNLEIVDTVDAAIEKILANGFSLTILDCKMDYPDSINPEDLIKLNYVACKGLILLGNRSFEKRIQRSIGKSLSELPVWRIDIKDIKAELSNTITKVLDFKIPSQQEMFNNIMSDIQIEKKSFIYKIASFVF